MKSTRCDLVEMAKQGQFDVILHGNCWCEMGAGVAKAVRQNFPEACQADLGTTPGDPGKLGTCSMGSLPVDGGEVDVVNASIPFNYSRQRDDEVLVDDDAVRSCMRWIKERYSGRRNGLPKIGAGRRGCDSGGTLRTNEAAAERNVANPCLRPLAGSKL